MSTFGAYLSASGRLAFASLILAAIAGCGADVPPRGAITGRVTVANQPLKEGRILFLPQAPNRGPTISAPIRDGVYTLDEADGPVLGLNRVEIEAAPNLGFPIDDEAAFAKRGGAPLPANAIPPAFGSQSTQTVDVQPGENEYNVSVPAR